MKPLFQTVPQMLHGHAAATPGAPALIVPDRGILTFGDLAELARDALEFLNARGLGREDRVALLIDDRPALYGFLISYYRSRGRTVPTWLHRPLEVGTIRL